MLLNYYNYNCMTVKTKLTKVLKLQFDISTVLCFVANAENEITFVFVLFSTNVDFINP